jgi:hypothetical protein
VKFSENGGISPILVKFSKDYQISLNLVQRALCRPQGQNHACSPRQSAENLRLRTSWRDFLRIFILQHEFYEIYVKLCEN